MDRKHWPGLKGRLHQRFGEIGLGMYSFTGCLLTMILIGLVGLCLKEPMVFPSLGPTILLFFERTRQPAACPRNTLIGHGIAIAAGVVSLFAFGLAGAPSVLATGITPSRVGAAALSLALTAFCKHLAWVPHPPAGATTLIISLGFLTSPTQLASMAAAVTLVTAMAWCLSYLFGVPMPLWRNNRPTHGP